MIIRITTLLIIVSQAFQVHSQSFTWAKAFGGPDSDAGRHLAIDAAGNLYVTGSFRGTLDFNGTSGNDPLISYGQSDLFVAKLNNTAEHLWSFNLGGKYSDVANKILLDANHNLLIGGTFADVVDFDPGPGVYNLDNTTSADQFILKLDPNGTFMWVNQVGNGKLNDLAMDQEGNIYAIGDFQNELTYEINGQLQSVQPVGSIDTYIHKLDPQGNTLWLKTFGGTNLDAGYSIRIDPDGDIYCAGVFTGETDLDPSSGSYALTAAGNYDIFLLKLDDQGDFLWGNQIGTPAYDLNPILETGAGNTVYLTGATNGRMFVQAWDDSGNLLWENEIAGNSSSDYISPSGIQAKADGSFLLTGSFIGTIDFDPSPGTYIVTTNTTQDGEADGYVAKYDSNGALRWVLTVTGQDGESCRNIVPAGNQQLVLLGNFDNDLEINSGNLSYYTHSAGESDLFIAGIVDENISGTADLRVSSIRILPNPAAEFIQIETGEEWSPDLEVAIINQLGQELMRTRVSTKDQVIDIADLPNGTYLVQLIFSPAKIIGRKLIIQKG